MTLGEYIDMRQRIIKLSPGGETVYHSLDDVSITDMRYIIECLESHWTDHEIAYSTDIPVPYINTIRIGKYMPLMTRKHEYPISVTWDMILCRITDLLIETEWPDEALAEVFGVRTSTVRRIRNKLNGRSIHG